MLVCIHLKICFEDLLLFLKLLHHRHRNIATADSKEAQSNIIIIFQCTPK